MRAHTPAYPALLFPTLLALTLTALLPPRHASAADATESYRAHCQNCHGPLDASNAPFYPSLIERARTLGPVDMVTAVMNGRRSPPGEFASHTNPAMPALDYLPNEGIAEIVNYLYDQAGRRDQFVSVDAVAAVRGAEHAELDGDMMTRADYARMEALYFEQCAGCHGTDRLGQSGRALDPASMQARSVQALMEAIHYGTPWGMPNWGTSGQLDAQDLSLLARYLKLPGRQAPPFTLDQATGSWQEIVPIKDRPRNRQFAVHPQRLFVSLLHDTGQLALIDGEHHRLQHIVDTDLAPHSIDVSADGRYLYVTSRSGRVALVDLYMAKPAVVARVRVGYASRQIAVSRNRRGAIVAAGGYTQPHVFLLDAQTLQPLGFEPLSQGGRWQAEDRILQLAAVARERRFLILTSSADGLVDLTIKRRKAAIEVQKHVLKAPERFRRGAFDLAGNHFMIPAGADQILAYDIHGRKVSATIAIPGLAGGVSGLAYFDSGYGPAWAATGAASRQLLVIGTDPRRHAEAAWRVVRQVELPGSGVLHGASHPASKNLWLDMTLNANLPLSGAALSVAVTQEKPVTTLPLRALIAPAEPHARAIHPQFNHNGTEAWYTLWNRQDLESAIVVIDDEKRQVKKVIRDLDLTTPIRTYSIATLLRR